MRHTEKTDQSIVRRKRAIIYCRVSTDKQEQDGESLEYQEEKCRRYAELLDHDVLVVLREVKSGFIHYSYREQLTLARKMIRDHLADMVIVWDLRRFSRNFVHSAMIFEEIEAAGGVIVSVSENIDNTLTGKLIRSILAWSAESEREKILEYANRRWQTRIELCLPVGTGFAPYGWQWGDKAKTFYVLHPEEAPVRFSIFHMFVKLDMSIRGIAHKLTEDGIPTATQSRRSTMLEAEALPGGVSTDELPRPTQTKKPKGLTWTTAAIYDYLTDEASMGTLVICKEKKVLGGDGKLRHVPHPERKVIPNGIPAIVSQSMFERAQRKLATNRVEKSQPLHNPQDFLLKGHLYCATCGYKMQCRNHRTSGLSFYYCNKFGNIYDRCPHMPSIRTNVVDKTVWDDCCQLFERLDLIQAKIEEEIEKSLSNLLEDSTGREQIAALTAAIDFAKQERAHHLESSYYYNLITQDIQSKMEQLQRYEEECMAAGTVAAASATYKERVMEFLEFINVIKGNYHNATFQEKRNALDVLGVKVSIRKLESGEKEIDVTYSPLFTGVNTS